MLCKPCTQVFNMGRSGPLWQHESLQFTAIKVTRLFIKHGGVVKIIRCSQQNNTSHGPLSTECARRPIGGLYRVPQGCKSGGQ